MEIKTVNPKLKQDQIAKKSCCSSSTLQRYKQYMNMLLPYRVPPNSDKRRQKFSNTKFDDNSHRVRDVKRPRIQTLLSTTQGIRNAN